MRRSIERCLLLFALAACGRAAPAPDPGRPAVEAAPAASLELDAARAGRMGVATARAELARDRPTASVAAIVLDPTPLFAAFAELQSADAVLDASTKSLHRLQSLRDGDGDASAQELEAATAQQLQDAARAAAARREWLARFGAPLTPRSTEAAVEDLAAGRMALLRIEAPEDSRARPRWHDATLRTIPAPSGAVAVVAAWPAPDLGPGHALPSWLALVRTPRRWPFDLRASVEVPLRGAARDGVVVPHAAVVFADDAAWAFVAVDASHYQRRRIPLDRPTAQGYFVGDAIRPGEQVVVAGAGWLLQAQGPAADDED